MSVRVNAESAAFYRSGTAERVKSNQKLERLINTMQRVAVWEYVLSCKC